MGVETAVYQSGKNQMRKSWDAVTVPESKTRAGGYTKRTKIKLERMKNGVYVPVEQCGQEKKYR